MIPRLAFVAALCCLAVGMLTAVSAQTTTGQLYYYEYPEYSCGSVDAQNPPLTDTVAVVSAADLKAGSSCFQCVTVTPTSGNVPQFTAQLVSSADGITGTDLGVAINFAGVYSVSYTFIPCSTATKLLGSSTSSSASPTPIASAVAGTTPAAGSKLLGSSTSSSASPTPTASAVAETTPAAASPTPSPTATATPSPSSTAAPVTATAVTASTNSADGSAAQATCTGQGTYYSQPQSPSTFYCAGNGLNGGYPGLPTVALNGADMTEASCGQCVVMQGTGITAGQAAASGQGTTPFPAVPTYATVNNKCPECSHCDIDYYTGYTQTKNGRYTITWDYIDCATALSRYNAQGGGSRKLLRSSSLVLDGPRAPLA
ncbi:TPA: hypothetical protein ACH3X1_001971 [Trebouxia sp. C0004]